jgi:hypothetical protein
MKRFISVLGSLAIATALGSPAFAGHGHGNSGNGHESMKGGLPALEDRVDADEALITTLQGQVADLQGQNNWAVVGADGTLVRSNSSAGPVTVTHTTVGSGLYEVDFSADVSGCAYEATLGDTGTATPPMGFVGVAGSASSVDGVVVQTSNTSGTAADEPFHLYVSCP